MRIAFVHTNNRLLTQLKTAMDTRFPAADGFHILNESIVEGLRRGEPRLQVYRRMLEQLLIAADGGAELIISTSVTLAPSINIARQVCSSPIINMADPVSAAAVRTGRRIAVLASNSTASGPSATILRQHAAAQGHEVIIENIVRPEAYTALYAGDTARHDAILTEAAEQALPRADVLVLAQATLAPLKQALSRLGIPVLDSLSLLMDEIGRRLAMEAHDDDVFGPKRSLSSN